MLLVSFVTFRVHSSYRGFLCPTFVGLKKNLYIYIYCFANQKPNGFRRKELVLTELFDLVLIFFGHFCGLGVGWLAVVDLVTVFLFCYAGAARA